MKTPRVHTDTCARCGCDRKEQRRGQFRCAAMGVRYGSHIWGWEVGAARKQYEGELS